MKAIKTHLDLFWIGRSANVAEDLVKDALKMLAYVLHGVLWFDRQYSDT